MANGILETGVLPFLPDLDDPCGDVGCDVWEKVGIGIEVEALWEALQAVRSVKRDVWWGAGGGGDGGGRRKQRWCRCWDGCRRGVRGVRPSAKRDS